MNENDIPRRNRIDLLTPAEQAIYAAVGVVEAVGADPLLTDAVVLLGQARDKVADYIDRRVESIERLKKFYSVTTLEDLALAQSGHVDKLQARLSPLRDERPGYVPRVG